MKKVSRWILGSMSVSLLSMSVAQAQEWRFNNFLPESRPESKELEQYAADVKEKTKGEIDIKVFSGGSLGLKNTDVLRFLPRGAVDMSLAWANYLGRDAESLSTVMVQGTIGSVDELKSALPEVKKIYAEEFSDWDVAITGYVALPMLEASIFCREDPINSLDGLRGKKLRVWAKDQVDTFGRLGISAQIIPQEEMYVAMKTGVVDCAVYPALYAHTVSLQEVAKYAAYLYPMASGPYILGMSQNKWDKLPEDHQQALLEAGDAIWERTNSYDDDHQKELAARAKMEESGVKWLADFPEKDRQEFNAAITDVWGELAKEAGGKAPMYRERVLTALGKK